MLRLRKNPEEILLTFKEKISDKKIKVWKELEIKPDNFELLREILKEIGMKESKNYRKNRVSYAIGKVKFELDSMPGIPTFLEIEAPTQEKVKKFVEKLGFSMSDAKPWTGKDVLKYYGKLS